MNGILNSARGTIDDTSVLPAQKLLQELLASFIVLGEDWEALPDLARQELVQLSAPRQLLTNLVRHRLLTDYQAARVEARTTFGLVLGNYRVLDRLGAGAMGVVFMAEHMDMRRQVAVKVLALSPDHDARILRRFYSEMRAVSQLHHPNIVGALDAGKCQGTGRDSQVLHYFVMEYVPGQDLEEWVQARGALAPVQACDLAHQIAAALAEAHEHDLVHRDIKPSNIRVTPEGQAKLLDFGLARGLSNRLTQPGTILGTMDFMAPEQVVDASTVDIRADIYGLGGTLFWCLTGQLPFQPKGNLVQDAACRLHQAPPSLRDCRPDIPVELDAVVTRMMALKPEDRFATPQAVMHALTPFFKQGIRDYVLPDQGREVRAAPSQAASDAAANHNILIVDDEAQVRSFGQYALRSEKVRCDHAEDGLLGLEAVRTKPYDLVLLDIDMPRMKGTDVCRHLRENPPSPHLKIIMMSGRATSDELAEIMMAGADDFLTKPLSVVQLRARVRAALRLKNAQDRSDLLHQNLLAFNAELERTLSDRDSDLVHARNTLVLALAELVGCRDSETGAHLFRLQHYCRTLAQEARQIPAFASTIDENFVRMLECCAPLHDIGKAGLPDHILLKPGKLDADERLLMQTHTTMGADTLQKIAKRHGFARAFLEMGIELSRSHHERFDGKGYPDQLAGDEIPLAARILAITDVYDALRSRRVYKPALSHDTTLHMMLQESPGHFDPSLLHAFQRCAPDFERIFRENSD